MPVMDQGQRNSCKLLSFQLGDITTFITVRFLVAYLDFMGFGVLGLGVFLVGWGFLSHGLGFRLPLINSIIFFKKGQSNIVLSSWRCQYTVRSYGPLQGRGRNTPELLVPCGSWGTPDLGVYCLLASCSVGCAIKRLAVVRI